MSSLPAIPFGRILRAGSRGNDVFAVRRALARAGFGDLAAVNTAFNDDAVRRLRQFQRAKGLSTDGVYGPRSHARLVPHFDNYSFLLFTGHPPPKPAPVTLQLPSVFMPTHQTAGLPGFPAIDVFAKAGAVVLAPVDGIVSKLSGHDPAEGGVPGGAYGWSLYLAAAHSIFFLTHFSARSVTLNDRVRRGDRLGVVCDAAVAGMPTSLSHIHEGKHDL